MNESIAEKYEEITEKYKKMHRELEERYYKRREISKEEFDRLHQQLWRDYEDELIQAGLRQPRRRPIRIEKVVAKLIEKGIISSGEEVEA